MLKPLLAAVTAASLALAAHAGAAVVVDFANGNNIGTTLTDPDSGTDFTIGVATDSETQTGGSSLSSVLGTSGGGLGVDTTGSDLNDGSQDLDNTFDSGSNGGVLESLLFTFSPAGSTTVPVDVVIDTLRVQNVNNDDEGVVISNGVDTLTLTRNAFAGTITAGSSTPDFEGIGFSVDAGQTLTIEATSGGSVRVRDFTLSVTPVPEPTAIAGLVGLGLIGLRRRR